MGPMGITIRSTVTLGNSARLYMNCATYSRHAETTEALFAHTNAALVSPYHVVETKDYMDYTGWFRKRSDHYKERGQESK